jgi:uncharacterized spore protein YtfJ
MVSELETAMAEARRAGEGGPIEGFVERIADRVGAHATVKAVFGDPIERDGITVIPVARVRWGFGGGAGSGPIPVGPGRPGDDSPFGENGGVAGTEESRSAGSSGFGSGGGGGVSADPIGWLEIGPDGAEFRPITPAMPSPGFMLAAGATAALVLRGLARLLRR